MKNGLVQPRNWRPQVFNAYVTNYDANFGAFLAQFSSPAVFGVGISIKSD